jgi:hypothetical protein
MLWVALCLVATTPPLRAQPAPAVTTDPVASPERVLFIGNSLMYYSGGLQTHTHRLASAANPPLEVERGYKSVHITGAGLDQYPIDFLVTPGNLGIREPFQLVVLAGNSSDAMSDASRSSYRQKVIEFDAAIKRQGGRTALLWLPAVVAPNRLANSDMFARDQDMMLSVGNEVGIPVGLAYHEAYRQRPDIKLQVYDGNHPSVAGQYLAACVVYASLYGRSPVGNPYNYFGALDDGTRAFLQKVAVETVQNFYGHPLADH